MRTFLDTNVLVYAFDQAEPDKRDCSQRLLRETPAESLVISSQVVSEFFVVTTRKLAEPLPVNVAAAAVRDFSALHVVAVDATLVQEAIALTEAHQLSLWDAQIVAAAIRAGCDRLVTEDLQDGQVFGTTQVSNPFTGLTG